MSMLSVKDGSSIEIKLYDKWWGHSEFSDNWNLFVKSLDENILKVRYSTPFTFIYFNDDVHKTWFILKWS